MKSKRTMIFICTWIFAVALATAAQSIAEERPPQTAPDTTSLDKAIKEKSETAKILGRAATPPRQTSPSTTPADKAIKRKLKQFPAYLNRWDSQQARNEGVFAH
jgi:hypothetical protein